MGCGGNSPPPERRGPTNFILRFPASVFRPSFSDLNSPIFALQSTPEPVRPSYSSTPTRPLNFRHHLRIAHSPFVRDENIDRLFTQGGCFCSRAGRTPMRRGLSRVAVPRAQSGCVRVQCAMREALVPTFAMAHETATCANQSGSHAEKTVQPQETQQNEKSSARSWPRSFLLKKP